MVIPFLITYSNILTNEYMYVCTYVGTWRERCPHHLIREFSERAATPAAFGGPCLATWPVWQEAHIASPILCPESMDSGDAWLTKYFQVKVKSELSFTNSLFILGACSHVHAQGIAPPWGFNWLQKSVETARSRDCTNNHSICMFHT